MDINICYSKYIKKETEEREKIRKRKKSRKKERKKEKEYNGHYNVVDGGRPTALSVCGLEPSDNSQDNGAPF